MWLFRKRLFYTVYRKGALDGLLDRCRSFSVKWAFLFSTILSLFGISCATIFEVSLVSLISLCSVLALLAIGLLRSTGYLIISSGFLLLYYFKQPAHFSLFSSFWSLGLAISLVLSWAIFLGCISLVEKEDLEKNQDLSQLTRDYSDLQVAYDKLLSEKATACDFLEKRAESLECELQQCRVQLKEALRKQDYLSSDLKVLSDQKTAWLEDYASLHNEYLRLVSGDETTSLFSWVSASPVVTSSKDNSDMQLWVCAVQEKDEKLRLLENELNQERQKNKSLEESCCNLKIRIQEVDSLKSRLVDLQLLISEKDNKIAQLRDEIKNMSPHFLNDGLSSKGKSYKDMYLQLKEQFAEKNKTLSLVRKELFTVQEEYLTLRKYEEVEGAIIDMQDIQIVHQLLAYAESLEQEIANLEELVSRSLFQ
ncbi:putative myosin heavy chain [Chlamydia ibidis]|uniref:Myosin heavy chain n=2 Tax=Chlamydia ibidis TaxID=1405396 RepID=A0ABN0MYJ0_9CHLA|nr:MFS transporter [Chlamydia ibidis]EPP34618.1 putative myosin heavy chain [Chlamydia ibidis]EQM62357.1 myosin heavy chain [Chlamydia ibidis 10-1398/6]